MALSGLAKKLFGSANERRLKPFWRRIEAINALEDQIAALSDDELRGQTDKLKARLADGARLDDLLEEAFATVREASKRALGMRHFDVQMLGGMILNQGKITEMKTGEGKTLVATLPVYLNALEGKGVHVVTVNDYLATRDSEWMGRVYKTLGLTVGCIAHGLTDEQRREAYAADVTYCTNNELGFDYLRDNMKSSLSEMTQRGHHYAIVDEVDSILIDEARTPLIISGPTDDKSELYIAVDSVIPSLVEDDYEIDEKARSISLTEEGNEHIEKLVAEAGLLEGDNLYDAQNVSIVHHVNNALRAHKIFQKDKDYIVRGGKVAIIDEFTGRMMEGRRWSDGLHQAVEAKEKVEIQPENQTLASITFQNLFRLYTKLSGMTGTAMTEESEFGDIYKLDVMEAPTNKPIARIDYDDELYMTAAEKYKSIVAQIADCHRRNQPVLVGTVSIEKSELLSEFLKDRKFIRTLADQLDRQASELKEGRDDETIARLTDAAAYLRERAKDKTGDPIPHAVLNARFHEQEAEIVANAGAPGAVTIATNMAGRGTDIQLGGSVDMEVMKSLEEGDEEATIARKREEIEKRIKAQKEIAIEAGGLYVLGTERHESRRIDNQLRGRSGRQGDPGASKFFLSLEDDLMRIFGDGMEKMLKRFGIQADESIEHPWFSKAVETAQKKVEQRNFDIRKNLLKFDDVINDQRKAIFEQRIEFMSADAVDDIVGDLRAQLVNDLVATHVPPGTYVEQWDLSGLRDGVKENFGLELPVDEWAAEEGVADAEIAERVQKAADDRAAARSAEIGPDLMRRIEKMVLLQTIDVNWREHLQQLDHLRSVIGLRAHGQRDPLNEFKTEAFALFEALIDGLRKDVTRVLMHVQVQEPPSQPAPIPMEARHADPLTGENEMDRERALAQGSGPRRTRRPSFSAGAGSIQAQVETATLDRDDPATWGRVPRNAPCPCGSNKKFKHCHGAV